MQRLLMTAAGIAAAAIALSSSPAFAGYGAFAYDADAGKYGYSSDEESARKADEAALKGCNSAGCKIVFRTTRRECGAIALTEDGKTWGGARRDSRSAAELKAIEICQGRTSKQCKMRQSACNR